MELVLVRHALPLAEIREEGVADPGLSPPGHHDALALAEYLRLESWDAFYSSEMRRATETLDPLAERCPAVPRHAVDDLGERDRNASWYVPIEDLRAEGGERWEQFLAGKVPGHEAHDLFRERAVTALERVAAAHPHQRVLVVCHGGVINAYLAHVLGIDLGERHGFFYPQYTSIHRVRAASDGRRGVHSMNELAHLHPALAEAIGRVR